MGQLNNENLEHSDIEAFREAIIGNGVITGLEVTESSTPGMTVRVSAGQCTIDAVVYTEGSAQNLNISNGDATHPRKDIVVYDATAGNPAVVAGTPAAAPVPPDIPSGDILLGIVLVVANESTSILNADITNDRVYSIKRSPHTSVSANTTLNDAHYVVTVDATGGARTITLPTAVGIRGKVYVIKKTDSSTNAVTVDPNGAQTIDGASTISLGARWLSAVIQSDGSNWIKIASDMNHASSHHPNGSDSVNLDYARGITPTQVVAGWDTPATNLANAVDGDLSTGTSVFSTTNPVASSEKEEYHIDLGGLKSVLTVIFHHRLIGADRLRVYLDTSVDNATWVQLASKTVISGNARFVNMGYPVEPIRYIRARYDADGTVSTKQAQIYSIQALAV